MSSSDTASDVSLEELQQRLVTFSGQLESIHELLQTDPENAEFLNIAKDLVEVIRLTKEMIDLKLSAADKSSEAPSTSRERAAAAAVRETAPARSTEATLTAEPPALAFSPGTSCEAQSNGAWYPAFIESITARNTYNVHYLGFGNKDELPETSLRAIECSPEEMPPRSEVVTSLRAIECSPEEMPPRSEVVVGYQCMAKYYVDSQWYTAAVTATTAYGFQVLFDGYGNTEEVPFEYLRIRPFSSGASAADVPPATTGAAETSKPKAAVAGLKPLEAVLAKPIKVPDNLQILPTDSEAEKERKRKRLKHIQKLNKQKEAENERTIKQHDWKSFQHKAMKKGVRGSGVLSKRGSMFASPDTVQGRVGVVGSGQGMTAFDDARKKVKRGHPTSSTPPVPF
ncbi:hypothetical protein P43SY_007726 [Pythium insidiosum]|uniref:Tudor domain-containing protein n=1 Tax=Pythium insidiosum TaxID=114742 RepID=A0AAD5LM01_PYTIN|nr:hypothetical protein P43SY_007726 [Pythium insidiosum]